MRILVGIDIGSVYKPALELAIRLKVSDPEFILANSVDTVLAAPVYGYPGEGDYNASYWTTIQELGASALERAADEACARHLRSETVSLVGAAAPALIDYANREGLELIVVQSERKSALGSLFLGSVSRGLAISAHCSVLISKGKAEHDGPLRAVFATDHSDYAAKAFDQFLTWAPAGIASLHIVSSAYFPDMARLLSFYEVSERGDMARHALLLEFERRTEELVSRAKARGYKATHEVCQTSPSEAIASAMTGNQADLLIMGAQGHGFMHRLLIGSTSLHQVVSEPWSVLLMRP